MPETITLPYGRKPLRLSVEEATVVEAPKAPPPVDLERALAGALDNPVASARLEELANDAQSVLVIVSDATRDEPRREMLEAVIARLPAEVALTVAIANGTHAPGPIDGLGIPESVLSRARIVNHDARADGDLVPLGDTPRGTPIRLNRCVAEVDLIVATGRIKPHYFAGFGAGVKAIFPGLGGNREVRINHEHKIEPGSRAGVVDGNPCREDLEDVLPLIGAKTFLLNAVVDAQGEIQGAVAGDVKEAFRRGAALCAPLFRARAPRSLLLVVSDALPMTGSLYQASKLVAAAAPLLADGGTMVIAAECPQGIGPVETVNRAIYEIGLKPRLPAEHRLVLVSGMDREEVEKSYCEWAPSVEAVLAGFPGVAPLVIPHASSLILEAR